jgi:hypothetical protein
VKSFGARERPGIACQPSLAALTDGYHAAFALRAAFAIGAAVLGLKVLRTWTESAANEGGVIGWRPR